MYNVNILVIYFLLCCVYGNFTHTYGMNFYFLSKVLKCIALYFSLSLWEWFFSHILSWENRVFIWRRVLEERGVFYGLFYYVCSLCILLCFHFPVSMSVCLSAVLHSHITTCTEQHGQFSQLTSELRLIMSFEGIVLHPQHTQSPVIERHKQTSILVVKLFASSVVAIVYFLFVLCEARACDDAFFSFLDFFFCLFF